MMSPQARKKAPIKVSFKVPVIDFELFNGFL